MYFRMYNIFKISACRIKLPLQFSKKLVAYNMVSIVVYSNKKYLVFISNVTWFLISMIHLQLKLNIMTSTGISISR